MPARSPTDATRFTATGPHAHQFTRSSSANATANTGTKGVPGETPQQRIARIRETARQAKMEKITLVDKLYVHGRVWADRAHKAVALGLIGATVLCGGITIMTFTEMIIHNRRLKRELAEEARRVKAAERQDIENQALVAAGEVPVASSTPQGMEGGKGIVANLKGWALSGLTPAGEEYKSRESRDGGVDVVAEAPETKWLPIEEGRKAVAVTEVPEPGKAGLVVTEKGTDADVGQGKGKGSSMLSWFGR